MISTPDLLIFFRLFLAHILADFFLQPHKWIVRKRSDSLSPYLLIHTAIVGMLTYLLLADWGQWQLPLFIMITHFLIDWWKSTRKDNLLNFTVDQLLHLFMLVIGWLWYSGFDITKTWHWINHFNTLAFWLIISSYLLVSRPIGFFIAKATAPWQRQLMGKNDEAQGLTDAGKWIGYLERVIILTAFFIGQYSVIGFLIAAKSIFRFSDKASSEKGRKQAEYILIGTLMSFLLAILTGIAVLYLIKY